jgi:hypothetical protein
VVVGRVDPQKLNCGPEGNHIKAEISPLAKAKFQFQLCQPFESPFAQDFDTVIQMLESIQGKIAQTGDRPNMIVSDMDSKLIRFTCNVFEQRVRACARLPSHPDDVVAQKQRIPGHTVYLADLESEDAGKNGRVPASKQRSRANGSADGIPVMDTEMEKSPIPSKHRDEFNSMKFDFMACPLKVYRGKTFVEPRDVIGALTGAVVEVYFGMRHYYLRDKKCDTFQAEIQQIRIVKPGSSIATSGFKRRDACEGPLDVMCNVGLTNGGDKDVRAGKRQRSDK